MIDQWFAAQHRGTRFLLSAFRGEVREIGCDVQSGDRFGLMSDAMSPKQLDELIGLISQQRIAMGILGDTMWALDMVVHLGSGDHCGP